MLDKSLRHIVDRGYTSSREIGELAGVSTSTVYRWMSGQSQPDFHAIRMLVRHLGHPKAQETLLSAFTSGTPWHCIHTKLDLDHNSDGQINADDALDASCAAVRSASESLHRIRKQCRTRSATADQTLEMLALLDHAARQCTIAQRVLVEMAERRRKKPLRMAK